MAETSQSESVKFPDIFIATYRGFECPVLAAMLSYISRLRASPYPERH
jgi:hypothetical protein